MATNTKPAPKKAAPAPAKAAAKKAPATKAAPAPVAKAPTKQNKAEAAAIAKEEAAKVAEKARKAAAAEARRNEAEANRAARAEANDAAKARVAELRGEGQKWPEIAEALGISVGKAQLLGAIAEGEAAGTKKATPALVKRDRDEKQMGWVAIAVQYGLSKAQTQKLYREAGGDPHASYVGKGGRYFSHEETIAPQRAALAAAKPAPTPRSPKEKAEPGTPVFAADAPSETVKGKLDGKTIVLSSGSGFRIKSGTVKVGTNKGVRVVQATDAKTGGTRTVKLDSIVKVTK